LIGQPKTGLISLLIRAAKKEYQPQMAQMAADKDKKIMDRLLASAISDGRLTLHSSSSAAICAICA
jgi:hypothetical protein